MSDTPTGRALEALPFIPVDNLDMIMDCLTDGHLAVIHRHATMQSPYALEVIAAKKVHNDIGRLSIISNFNFRDAVSPEYTGLLRSEFMPEIKSLRLEEYGITTAYSNNEKKSVRLAINDSDRDVSVTTWFSSPGMQPNALHVSNERRDGQDREVSSSPPRFERDSAKQAIIDYMKLLSIVGGVLGKDIGESAASDYAVNFVERRTISRRNGGGKRARQEKTRTNQNVKAQQTANKKAADEMTILDEKYKPNVPNPNVRLVQVHGIDADSKSRIDERLLTFMHPKLAAEYGADCGGGILLHGPAGTGKTMAAMAIANEAGPRTWQIDGSDIVEKWVGNSAANVTNLFENAVKAAKLGPLTLVFDEIDSIITTSSEQNTERASALGEFKRKLAYVATEVPNILILATTNHPDKLGEAFMRSGRFDLKVYMDAPDDQARMSILLDHINFREAEGERIFDDMNNYSFDGLTKATKGMTGADIGLIIKSCRGRKFREHIEMDMHPGPITHEDILKEIIDFNGQSKVF